MPANNTLKVFPTLQYFGQNTPLFPQVNFVGSTPYQLNNCTIFLWRQINSNNQQMVAANLAEYMMPIKFLAVFNQDLQYSQLVTFRTQLTTTSDDSEDSFSQSLTVPPGGFMTTCSIINLTAPFTITSMSPNSSLSYLFVGA